MKRIAVSELKNKLSEYLRLVKRGETIEILEHAIPIARIEAVRPSSRTTSNLVEKLVRDGLVRGPLRRPDKTYWSFAPLRCDGDAARAVVEERGER